MSRSNRAKRLWKQIAKIDVTAPDGREGVLLRPPDDWLDMHTGLPPEMADDFVRDLRALGVDIWLHPDGTGNVRTRFVFADIGEPDAETMHVLAKYARDIAKAVARSGKWDPPKGNPFGDQPLPPGGHWTWEKEDA